MFQRLHVFAAFRNPMKCIGLHVCSIHCMVCMVRYGTIWQGDVIGSGNIDKTRNRTDIIIKSYLWVPLLHLS